MIILGEHEPANGGHRNCVPGVPRHVMEKTARARKDVPQEALPLPDPVWKKSNPGRH